jgi:hypothetical protein
MQNRLLTSVFLFLSLLLSQLTFAQQNQPCNTSQPRPITGNQHPCPGSLETYCIPNDRNYTSFEWDVPRAQAGNPPTGWQIVSGQGTACVTVRVGTKSGTMKVKVNDPICGTKVATLPVKPSRGFIVDINGPDSVCASVQQIFTATVSDSLGRGNGNGKGQVKGTFNFNWSVPAGWVIVSGQGTNTIKVTPGATGGQVTVSTTYSSKGSGKGNNGNGVGGYKGYCNTTASDAIEVKMKTNCGSTPPTCAITAEIAGPDTVCAYYDSPYTFTTPAQNGATYTWMVPADWFIESGEGTNTITVFAGFEPGDVTVTVTNNCGTATDAKPVAVNEFCDAITPLPVELTAFEGKATAEGIALSWSTATEKNNDKFEVQRSADGRSFETIGTVKGNGSTTTQQAYSFLDKRPASGLNYFRLRQVDFDGASEFSKVISVSANGKAAKAMTLFPNPATGGEFNVRLAQSPEAVTLQVTDLSGKVLHSREVKNASEVNINGSALGMKPGIYLISLKNGKNVSVEKLIMR